MLRCGSATAKRPVCVSVGATRKLRHASLPSEASIKHRPAGTKAGRKQIVVGGKYDGNNGVEAPIIEGSPPFIVYAGLVASIRGYLPFKPTGQFWTVKFGRRQTP